MQMIVTNDKDAATIEMPMYNDPERCMTKCPKVQMKKCKGDNGE